MHIRVSSKNWHLRFAMFVFILNLVTGSDIILAENSSEQSQTFYGLFYYQDNPNDAIFKFKDLDKDFYEYVASSQYSVTYEELLAGITTPHFYSFKLAPERFIDCNPENVNLLFNEVAFKEFWNEGSQGKQFNESYFFRLSYFPGICAIVRSNNEHFYIPLLYNGDQYGNLQDKQIYSLQEFKQLLDHQPVNITVNGNDLECTVPAFISYGQVFAPIRELLNAIGYEVLWDAETNLINFYHEDGPYYKINYIKPSYYITEVENIDFTVFEGDVRYHGDILDEVKKKLVNLRTFQGKTMIAMEGYFTDDFLAIVGYDCIIDKEDNHISINAVDTDSD